MSSIDAETAAKIFSRALTAMVSIRSLVRSGVGIKKLLKAQKEVASENTSKESPKQTPKKDDKKQKQLHGALTGMGYSKQEADRAVKELSNRIDSDSLSDLVRAALGILNS